MVEFALQVQRPVNVLKGLELFGRAIASFDPQAKRADAFL